MYDMNQQAAPRGLRGSVRADANPNPEQMLKDIQAELKRITDGVKQTAENALSEVNNLGTTTAETSARADQLLTAQNALSENVKALTDRLEGVEGSLGDVSQTLAAGGRGSGAAARQTLGAAVLAECEDKIKGFLAGGCRGSVSITVQNAITTAAGSGGGLIFHEEEREPVNYPRRALRIRDLVTQGSATSDLVTFRQQVLRTNAAAAIAETGTYPQSAFGWDKATAQVKKIGHTTQVSEEAVADADQLQTEIDSELRYGLELEEENQLLLGDGVGDNLLGLIPQATAFVAAAGLPNTTRIERLRLAILQVTLADYVADSIVLNPTDWTGIDLLKDNEGRFIFGNPGAQSTPTLWGKSVVESNSMTPNEWMVGNLRMAATAYNRSDVEVLISSEDGTNFVEDMLTMKARKRLAFAVKRTAAIVTGNFS